jgi:hypothetical protein
MTSGRRAAATWEVKGKDLFLLAVFRRRLECPALKRAVCEQQRMFNAEVVLSPAPPSAFAD